jgi:hypothetical protein
MSNLRKNQSQNPPGAKDNAMRSAMSTRRPYRRTTTVSAIRSCSARLSFRNATMMNPINSVR